VRLPAPAPVYPLTRVVFLVLRSDGDRRLCIVLLFALLLAVGHVDASKGACWRVRQRGCAGVPMGYCAVRSRCRFASRPSSPSRRSASLPWVVPLRSFCRRESSRVRRVLATVAQGTVLAVHIAEWEASSSDWAYS
jgi:hypothetical protein